MLLLLEVEGHYKYVSGGIPVTSQNTPMHCMYFEMLPNILKIYAFHQSYYMEVKSKVNISCLRQACLVKKFS